MKGMLWSLYAFSVLTFTFFSLRASEAELTKTVATMESVAGIEFKEGTPKVVPEGPGGVNVLRFEGREADEKGVTGRVDAKFSGRINLKALGLDPKEYDLIAVEVKAARAAVLQFALENHPNQGDLSYWWALDGLRGAFDWKTIWIDLRRLEELKAAGDSRVHWRAGMTAEEAGQTGLRFSGFIKDTGRKIQGEDRRIWLGRIRLVKKAVNLDWDQTQAPYRWDKGQDLVYTYPLTVTNCLDQPVSARLSLQPFKVKDATAKLAQEQIELGPKEGKTVQAEVRLPAAVAASAAPLYSEMFEARVEAAGFPDSAVTILRCADPIHLTVTVPLPEDKLQFPLFPKVQDLPDQLTRFDEPLAKSLAAAQPPEKLIETAMEKGIYNYTESDDKVAGTYRMALVSAAYLYRYTGDKKYLELTTKLLAALPDIWKKFYADWQKDAVRVNSSGIMVRWGAGAHGCLGLGWRLSGTQRSPYLYSDGSNAKGGRNSAMYYAFDMVAAELDETLRKRIIAECFVPAALQTRNHYVGDGNQQCTANMTALYAGLVSRNWPLVSFACSSEHGLPGVMDWCFDDTGNQIRKNYQTYTVRPMLWMMELLYGRGINMYSAHKERLATLMGHGFEDTYFWNFVVENRLKPLAGEKVK